MLYRSLSECAERGLPARCQTSAAEQSGGLNQHTKHWDTQSYSWDTYSMRASASAPESLTRRSLTLACCTEVLCFDLARTALTCLCLLVLLGGTVSTRAQSANTILKQAARAMGGEKSLKRIRAWESSGTIRRLRDGATGIWQAAAMQSNLYTSSYNIEGFEASLGYNGKSGWQRDSRAGLRTLTGNASRDMQAEAVYRASRWLNAGKGKSRLAVVGQTTIEGKAARTVLLTSVRGAEIRMHFDAASGLLLREEIPAGDVTRVIDYADYRSVNSVQEPFAINLAIVSGETTERYEIRLAQIVHNPRLDEKLFDIPKVSAVPVLEVEALLKAVGENADEIERQLDNYAYTEIVTSRKFDKQGVLKETESETIELSFYRGYRIRRQIAKNAQPLSASAQEKEDRKVEKRIREIEKELAEREQKREARRPGEDNRRVSIADMFRASLLLNPRRERFRNREMIVFDFEPNPEYKPKKDIEKFAGKTVGTMWIDPADKQIARIEARLIESYKVGGGLLASLSKGSSFVLEQDRINNEIWLPTAVDVNISVRALLLIGITANQTVRYSNYKRFNVEAEKEKLGDPTKAGKKPGQ